MIINNDLTRWETVDINIQFSFLEQATHVVLGGYLVPVGTVLVTPALDHIPHQTASN